MSMMLKVIKTDAFNNGKLFYTLYVREVDKNGNVTKEELDMYKSTGELSSIDIRTYEYSETGYKIKVKEIKNYQDRDDSTIIEKFYTNYNEKNCVIHTLYDSTEIYDCFDYQYDDNGNIVCQISYGRDGSVIGTKNTVNGYDSHGNLVTTTTTSKNSTGAVTEVSVTIYEYSLVDV